AQTQGLSGPDRLSDGTRSLGSAGCRGMGRRIGPRVPEADDARAARRDRGRRMPVSPLDEDAKIARDVTIAAAGLNVAGMALDTLFWRVQFHRMLAWHLVSLGFSVVLLVYLPLRRAYPPARLSAAAFVLNNVVIVAALWFAD